MNAASFIVLGVVILVISGCGGAGPNVGWRTGCYSDRHVPDADTPPPAFFLVCRQSP
jgi:hypothetical protein